MKFTKEWFESEGVAIRERCEAADMVKFCWTMDKLVYAVTMKHIPRSWVKIERAATSKGGKLKARIRPNTREKAALLDLPTCEVLGTLEALENAYREAYMAYDRKMCALDSKRKPKTKAPKNNGWMFECAVTERAGQVWEPDSVPFWEAPDVLDNGIGYQVKGDEAEYFTEQNLEGCMAAMGL